MPYVDLKIEGSYFSDQHDLQNCLFRLKLKEFNKKTAYTV